MNLTQYTHWLRDRLTTRLSELANLKDNWDGEDSPAPSEIIIQNARTLIAALPEVAFVALEAEDDLMPQPGGKLTLDWFMHWAPTRRVLSIEIAANGCGAYARPPTGGTLYFEYFPPDAIPDALLAFMDEHLLPSA